MGKEALRKARAFQNLGGQLYGKTEETERATHQAEALDSARGTQKESSQV